MLPMSKNLKILVAQLNPVVGDIKGNLELARGAYAEAKDKGADVLVLSELFILGYPAEDLVLKPAAVELSMKAVGELARETEGGPAVIIGSPWMDGKKRHNSAVLLQGGAVAGRYDKRELPNYGVFERSASSMRATGRCRCSTCAAFAVASRSVRTSGIRACVCPGGGGRRNADRAERQPWRRTVQVERHTTFSAWRKTGVPYLFVNQVGGQDELVFDGASYAVDSTGRSTSCWAISSPARRWSSSTARRTAFPARARPS